MTSTNPRKQNSLVVSEAQWLEARKKLLRKEKELTRLRDELSRERRDLPWVKVEKEYIFDGPKGKESLATLFGGKSQLVIYHFMFGPDWAEGCPSCSLLADHFDGSIPHLAERDVRLVAVSRAPLAKIEAFKKRMGWRFQWMSSHDSDFNFDYHVSFTQQDMAAPEPNYNYGTMKFPSDEGPGASVFYKDSDGAIFHTYSTFGRGLDAMIGAYNWLDISPKGRDEDSLPHPMAWVRHHDKYHAGLLDPNSILLARKA